MKFGPRPLSETMGHILAHSFASGDLRISKGTKLDESHIAALLERGVDELVVAALATDDVEENEAAENIGASLALQNIHVLPPVSGRVNLYANEDGVFDFDENSLIRGNLVDEGISLALLSRKTMVKAGQLLGTLKIIPYAVTKQNVDAVIDAFSMLALLVAPYRSPKSTLILTVNAGLKPSLVKKGEDAVRARLAQLGQDIAEVKAVPHHQDAIAQALINDDAEMIYILTAAATSDRQDVAPSAVVNCGGRIERFGIPVDPGNLLFWGTRSFGKRVQNIIGLPGCVRAPAINGADFVVARLLSGEDLSPEDFAMMGIGGLLKENVTRPKPRLVRKDTTAPRIALLVLAAGASSRMKGEDKLTKEISGSPLLLHVLDNMSGAQVDATYAVTSAAFPKRLEILNETNSNIVLNPAPEHGIGSSIAIGVRHIAKDYDAVVITLADMPEITKDDINKLIQTFLDEDNVEICRAVTDGQKGGHPVLFGKRFFEELQQLDGDIGARELIKRAADFVKDVELGHEKARIDLDTQEDFASYLDHDKT